MAYNEYKSIPQLWNLSIPTHWDVLPLYAMAKEKSISNCTELPLLSVYLDEGVVPFSARSERRTNATSSDLSKYQRVDPGDFVLNNQQAWRGSVGVSKNTGIISPAYIVLKMDDTLLNEYANYLFRSRIMVDQYLINSKSVGSIQRNIYWPTLKRVSVLVPPVEEQEKMVNFLNWKVSTFNRLINNKKREIKEVSRMKHSLISDAVIHGVVPNAPLKYSGVKWLGNIPAHWTMVKLRQILTPVSVKNHPELPLLSVTREQGVIVRNVESKEENHNYIPDDLSGYKVVRKGQFAMNKMKAWQGSYGISDYTGIVSPAYFIFDVNFENLEYFHFAIRSKVYVNFFAQASDGIRVGQWDLQMDKMKEIPFIIPPAEEQIAIVEHVRAAMPKYDALIEKLEEEVKVLEEYKAKLIADVVTGKIDVRNVEVHDYEFEEELGETEDADDVDDDDASEEEV